MVGGRCSGVIETFKVVSLRVELGLGDLPWESIATVPGYRLDKVGAPVFGTGSASLWYAQNIRSGGWDLLESIVCMH